MIHNDIILPVVNHAFSPNLPLAEVILVFDEEACVLLEVPHLMIIAHLCKSLFGIMLAIHVVRVIQIAATEMDALFLVNVVLLSLKKTADYLVRFLLVLNTRCSFVVLLKAQDVWSTSAEYHLPIVRPCHIPVF